MQVPLEIRTFVEESECDPVHVGKSGASVFRLSTHARTLFLKTCVVADGGGLGGEAERLRWLAGRLSVPDVVSFAKDDSREYLLVTSVPGVNGVEAGREHPEQVATGLAQALKMLHAQPVEGCPFDQTVAAQIERARQRVASGLIDEADWWRRRRRHFDLSQKEEGAERLVLRRRADVPRDRQVREERGDLPRTHLRGMALSVKEDEAADPAHVGFLRSPTSVSRAQGDAHAIEELRSA